jgi:hypothetical protein
VIIDVNILKQTHKVGIANVVISTRQYVAALPPVNDMILMTTLRYANEVLDEQELDILPKGKGVGVTAKEREMGDEEPRPDSRGLCCFMLRMSRYAAPCSHPHPPRWGIPA